jgi:hypothetical protein
MGAMEHLLIWLIHYLLKAFTEKKPAPSARPVFTPAPPDVWANYRRKQAAIEREMTAKSPTARKN